MEKELDIFDDMRELCKKYMREEPDKNHSAQIGYIKVFIYNGRVRYEALKTEAKTREVNFEK